MLHNDWLVLHWPATKNQQKKSKNQNTKKEKLYGPRAADQDHLQIMCTKRVHLMLNALEYILVGQWGTMLASG
jgi:hypothetical protein